MARDLSQILQHVTFVVGDEDVGRRLDHFVGDKVFWRSRSDLQKRIKAGAILLDGATTKPSLKLRAGQIVTVQVRPEDLPDQDPAAIAVEVLFEDDDIVVVNKQAGLVVHPTGRHVYDTLMNALHLRYRDNPEASPHVVHRLDRMTSGVLVVAKREASKKILQDAFEAREPEKVYHALVEGEPNEETFDVEQPIGSDEASAIRLKMCVRADGAFARTRFRVLERFDDLSVVEATLETGRQHQIRVHLSWAGWPVLADPLYGNPHSIGFESNGEAPTLRRQALHAGELSLTHPRTREALTFRAPWPSDMQKLLDGRRSGRLLKQMDDEQSGRWS